MPLKLLKTNMISNVNRDQRGIFKCKLLMGSLFSSLIAGQVMAQSLPPNAKLFEELPSFKFYILDRSSNQRGDYVRNNNDGTFTGLVWVVGIGKQKGTVGRLIVDANCSKKLVRHMDIDSGEKKGSWMQVKSDDTMEAIFYDGVCRN